MQDGEGGWIDIPSFEIFIDNNIILDVKDIDQSVIYKIFPNPVNDFLTIEFSEFYGDYQIQLFNIHGSKVFEGNYSNTQSININLVSYPAGSYFLRIGSTEFNIVESVIVY